MKSEEQYDIKIKIAISLNTLLSNSKGYYELQNQKKSYGKSYNKIALIAELRKATVSDIFNAKSNCQATTLIPIIKAMGYNLADFAKIYDKIEEPDIKQFILEQKEKVRNGNI